MILRVIAAISIHAVRMTCEATLITPILPWLLTVVARNVPDALAPHHVAET